MLKINALTKKLGDTVVLNDLNLSIEAGSIFGLIGPNGAGKSTLLRIIAGVYKPDLGCVTVDDVKVYDNEELKKDILLISDDPHYFFQSTIYEMKQFYKSWYPNLNEEVYHKFLNVFKLNEHKPINNFSKGMKRQAFIILGLAIMPKILMLDEAFDGLDPVMRLTFKKAIAEMLEDQKMTVIISSHNLREMEDICDTFGILENGKIVTGGNLDEEKGNIHKIQMAFQEEITADSFKNLHVLSITITSRIVTLVVKGNIEKIEKQIQELNPLMMDILQVNLEELFIYEMFEKGYGQYEKHD